jgi:hypothetical protein
LPDRQFLSLDAIELSKSFCRVIFILLEVCRAERSIEGARNEETGGGSQFDCIGREEYDDGGWYEYEWSGEDNGSGREEDSKFGETSSEQRRGERLIIQGKLQQLSDEEKAGKKLTEEQVEARSKLGEVDQQLDFTKEITKVVQLQVKENQKQLKEMQKREFRAVNCFILIFLF